MDLFGGTIRRLENGLSFATLKNKTIAQNIANVDTPNYKTKEVSFKDVLNDAKSATISANRTDARHYDFNIEIGSNGVYSNENFRSRPNGNAVNMDTEQAKLAENTIYYNALIERMNGKFSTLNAVVKGGR
ncbi:flagellar basal body rod protein FlgB [Lysinibacillus sp. 2017]|uniref:flagellar basal body rod protein FlgB n=1 Tax=unclassified Lysinibacillus TaxID=2636778 RepID=UPI000D52A717|nr:MULTISPECIES: flagellar basal body rod protein FlgB [unclassified Lysinibacillus]AWE06669.1 flagellar basal body rod protein FlgB [Lysinibacillus sp. 2017]TGN37399.1 flagellar basal body rod protein FlgB [Lysinibacillus sp. S2017]